MCRRYVSKPRHSSRLARIVIASSKQPGWPADVRLKRRTTYPSHSHGVAARPSMRDIMSYLSISPPEWSVWPSGYPGYELSTTPNPPHRQRHLPPPKRQRTRCTINTVCGVLCTVYCVLCTVYCVLCHLCHTEGRRRPPPPNEADKPEVDE
jgi:hypothetical protein